MSLVPDIENYVSLVVNDEDFAARYAVCLTATIGLAARLEPVTRPSCDLQRDVPGSLVNGHLARQPW
ncbi:hypothetical protein [Streptomyces tibetensis]|uniref:hypothetical protein n=1 Tax=Streptomyces tibetensis TaxID=2382123 RepID=UPI00340A5332